MINYYNSHVPSSRKLAWKLLQNKTFLNLATRLAWTFLVDPSAPDTIQQAAAKHEKCVHEPLEQ